MPENDERPEIEVSNEHMVGMRGDGMVTISFPRPIITPDEALQHAAWLVSIAEPFTASGYDFADYLKAVQSDA